MKESILNLKLKITGGTGDGKRLFFGEITDDNWQECRLEADTDDADEKHVKACVNRIIACVNAMAGIEKPAEFVKNAQSENIKADGI